MRPGVNGLLLASRWPLRRLRLPCAPSEPCRWLLARILAPEPLALGVMHVPNRVGGRKYPFLDAVLSTAQRRWATPALLLGDTNSGRIGLDEQVPAFNRIEDGWMRELDQAGWTDAYRHLRGAARAYTWYSPNGGQRIPDRPGLPQPRAPAPAPPIPLRLGPPVPSHRTAGQRSRGHGPRPDRLTAGDG